jgi:hypothetical protein
LSKDGHFSTVWLGNTQAGFAPRFGQRTETQGHHQSFFASFCVTPKLQKRKNYLKKQEKKERTSFCEQKEAKKL